MAATVPARSAGAVGVWLTMLSGGEPTIHPALFEIIEVLERPEVGRIVLNSNGLRIAEDDELCRRLAEHPKVYVCLHFDGPSAKRLRGIDHAVQIRAIERLSAHEVNVVPLVLAADGVNDRDLGPVVTRLLGAFPAVKSVILSMMTYTGKGGAGFPGDPLTRLTIASALDRLEETSQGALRKDHFLPLPMPNPLCAAIGYFLTMDGQITPLIPFAPVEDVVEATKNANFGKVDAGLEALLRQIIDTLYARDDEESRVVLGRCKRLLRSVFPTDRVLSQPERQRRAEAHIRTVYLMQFMDSWSFDAKRLQKCSCQHLLPGGTVIPSCGYYTYHRRFDPRFA